MADVEIVRIGEYDTELRRRDFDAISYGQHYWRGVIEFEPKVEDEGLVLIYSDRDNLLGDDYAGKNGRLIEVVDAALAAGVIARAITSCFDHSITYESLSDGQGGWIVMDTDN